MKKKLNLAVPLFKETEDQERFRKRYLQSMAAFFQKADFAGLMDLSEDQAVALMNIYVPLRFSGEDQENFTPDEIDNDKESFPVIDLLEKNRRAVILGGPGSGKTTLTRYLAWALSTHLLPKVAVQIGRRLVVPFILREYPLRDINSAQDLLTAFIEKMERSMEWDKKGWRLKKEDLMFYIRKGWALFLFDGIDEVTSPEVRKKLRQWVVNDFSAFSGENYLLCTSRPVGYDTCPFDRVMDGDTKEIKKQFDRSTPARLFVTPFNRDQEREFSLKWHALREKDPDKAKKNAEKFIIAVQDHKGLHKLKRRPVFLTLMAHVHLTKQELPHSRVLLYEEILRTYLETLDKQKEIKTSWSFTDKKRLLEAIAFTLHEKASREDKGGQEAITLKRSLFLDIINETIKDAGESWETIRQEDGPALLTYFISRTGLLSEPAADSVQFTHLSFQEFLAASWLMRLWIGTFERQEFIDANIVPFIQKPFWRETFILFFNLLALSGESAVIPKIFSKIVKKGEDEGNFPAELAFVLLTDPYHLTRKNGEELLARGLESFYGKYTSERVRLLAQLEGYRDHLRSLLKIKLGKEISLDEILAISALFMRWHKLWKKETGLLELFENAVAGHNPEKMARVLDYFAHECPSFGKLLLKTYPLHNFIGILARSNWTRMLKGGAREGVEQCIHYLDSLALSSLFHVIDEEESAILSGNFRRENETRAREMDRDLARDRARELDRALDRARDRDLALDMILFFLHITPPTPVPLFGKKEDILKNFAEASRLLHNPEQLWDKLNPGVSKDRQFFLDLYEPYKETPLFPGKMIARILEKWVKDERCSEEAFLKWFHGRIKEFIRKMETTKETKGTKGKE